MGNSMGGFKEYWDVVRKYPTFQGGFIWDFADQALTYRDAKTGELTYRYGGCYNDRDFSDFTFCCNGFVAANRELHPTAYEVKHQYQNIWASNLDAGCGRVSVQLLLLKMARYWQREKDLIIRTLLLSARLI